MKLLNVEIRSAAVAIEYVRKSDLLCDVCNKPQSFLVTIIRNDFSFHELLCEANAKTLITSALVLP